MAAINGDNGNNVLNGTAEEDTIRGFGGNDTIDSVDRPDSIFAGSINPRRDIVIAGSGDDFVTGGKFDRLNGGDGNDFLQINFNFNGPVAGSATPITLTLDSNGTGTASDGTFITGFESVNFNLSDAGDNAVNTGNVRAQITAGNGNDTLTTGSADDVVFGGGGNNVISTGAGNDTISGGSGNDTVSAGDGDDTFGVNVYTDGSDQVNLGAGNDTVRFDRFDGGSGNIRVTFTSAEVGNGSAFDANTLANQDGGLAVRVQAEDANGNLTGPISRYDDEGTTFVAGTQGITFDVRDLVSGVARGDTFEGVVLGTSGSDALTFFPPFRSGQNFYYNAGMGDDTVTAGEGSDFLVGGGGSDQLSGNGGNDSFIGGGGSDTILGGAGNDTVIVNVSTDGADAVNLGDGSDVVTVNSATPGQVRLTFTSGQVGNGNPNDSNTMANQDGGLAVRLQGEDSSGNLTGLISRYDDEGTTFTAGAGVTFDIRDLVSGAQRGNQFEVATLGTAANDTLTAIQGNRSHYFNAGMGDDAVTGGNANDFLVGGAGADTMVGGLGNDTYVVDNVGDVVTEVAGQGSDTVLTSLSTYTLADNLEALTYTGTGYFTGSGNDLANVVTGGNRGNRLNGGAGADTLVGGLGNDTYIVDNAADVVVEQAGGGVDRVLVGISYTLGDNVENLGMGTSASLDGTGNALANLIVGNNGNNVLDGRAGADTMVGGLGNDTYVVDNVGDVVTELTGQGSDTVLTSLSTYTLADNVEALTYTGTGYFTGSGNDLANVVTGGNRGNRLNGGAGADTLVGGLGNDTYIVDNAADVVVEQAGGGVDRVLVGVSYTLGDNVENLGMGTSASLDGTGNALANLIVGNNGNNVLDGRSGADTLTGGLGQDTFVLRAGETSGDTVTDFVRGTDTLAFYGFGTDAVLSQDSGSDVYTVTSADGLTSGSFRLTGVSDLDLAMGGNNTDARFFA